MNKPRPADATLYPTPADIENARARHAQRAEALRLRLGGVTKVIGGALLLALTLRSLVFEPFTITSPSMQPGLLVGDYLFVAKWPYGYSRYSLPLALPLFEGRIPAGRMAKRGDVVVFKATADNRTDFIKRVIGLPGDSVAVTHGQLVLNGVAVPRVAEPASATQHRFRETLAGRSYVVTHSAADTPLDDFGPVVVPPDHYFMLGDNRDNSADSRLALIDGGVGMVPAGNLVGRADRVFFSVDAAKLRQSPVHWGAAIRTDRIGAQF
ncbi:signal peptidase I [Polymorphobacter arshaanensis]|nr:signal peptidase I [Polymorphobacter arshaanensis]